MGKLSFRDKSRRAWASTSSANSTCENTRERQPAIGRTDPLVTFPMRKPPPVSPSRSPVAAAVVFTHSVETEGRGGEGRGWGEGQGLGAGVTVLERQWSRGVSRGGGCPLPFRSAGQRSWAGHRTDGPLAFLYGNGGTGESVCDRAQVDNLSTFDPRPTGLIPRRGGRSCASEVSSEPAVADYFKFFN